MWIWTKGTAEDIKKIFKKNEELTVMYVSSMELALKSPHSATVNTSLHYFIHFTSGLVERTRTLTPTP